MIKTCPLTIECKVFHTVNLPTNSFFIGEIITIYSEDRFLTDGKPDAKKIIDFFLEKSKYDIDSILTLLATKILNYII